VISKLEEYLQDKISPDLEKGRLIDKKHTLKVVEYVKNILDQSPTLKADREVLLISAFAHDWGYTNQLDPNIPVRLEHLGALKEIHMRIGEEKLTKLLEDKFFDQLTNDQKTRAIHIVSVHDKLDSLKDDDELVLMEADTLAGLDPEIMGVFADEASESRFLRKNRELRFCKFISGYSKKEYERLYVKRVNYSKSPGATRISQSE
jgi:hypothetical protein